MKKIIYILIIAFAINAENISLPKPKLDGGMPLYTALKNRATFRSFSTKEISDAQLSQILWSAAGVNRKEGNKRTSPTAWGNNEITLYVLLKKGSYVYKPIEHKLELLSSKDIRVLGGRQDFVKDAPVTIVMVTNLEKISQTEDENVKMAVSQMDAGYVSQNIYLAAASEGLVTGARANIDKEKLGAALKLEKKQRIILANSVGFVKK